MRSPRLLGLEALALVAAAALTAGGCGSGSSATAATAPSAPSGAAVPPTVTAVAVSGTAPAVGSTSQLTATATLSDGSAPVVTSLATWQSSNPAVLTVSTAGIATAVAAGDADVTATYAGVSGKARLTVSPRRYSLTGTITDDGTGRAIVAARVEVLTGVNAGSAVSTDASGGYAFDALAADTFRIRASADDYQWGEQGVTVPANPRADFALRKLPPPCVVTASPTFIGVSSGGIVTPAHLQIDTAAGCAWTIVSHRLLLGLKVTDVPAYMLSGTGPATVLLGYGVSLCAWTDQMSISWNGGQTYVTVEQFFPKC